MASREEDVPTEYEEAYDAGEVGEVGEVAAEGETELAAEGEVEGVQVRTLSTRN